MRRSAEQAATAEQVAADSPAPVRTDVPALEIIGLRKAFGAVQALRDASLTVWPGEVVGLLGDNGAGKSTLVKCVAGRLHADGGMIRISGRPVSFRSPKDARAAGIEVVHQNLALVNTLDVASNLFLGREVVVGGDSWLGRLGILRKNVMRNRARAVLTELNIRLPSVRADAESLSGGQRQGVAVGRAAAWGQSIMLLDEPTAALGVEQTKHLLDLIRDLARKGIAIVLITHNMQQAMEVCDRAVILRHGVSIGSASISEVTPEDLVGFITGAQPVPASKGETGAS